MTTLNETSVITYNDLKEISYLFVSKKTVLLTQNEVILGQAEVFLDEDNDMKKSVLINFDMVSLDQLTDAKEVAAEKIKADKAAAAAKLISIKAEKAAADKAAKDEIKKISNEVVDILSLDYVREALHVDEVKALQQTVNNVNKQKFVNTLALSKIVKNAFDWYKSDEGITAFADNNVKWTTEDFIYNAFGYKKSMFYKLVKCGELNQAVIDTFNEKCENLLRDGEQPDQSLDSLLKFAKDVKSFEEAANEGDGGEGDGENEAPEVEKKAVSVFNMTYKIEGLTVAVRVDDSGTMFTKNSLEDIKAAVAFLNTIVTSHKFE